MPDPLRPLRRLTDPRLFVRAISHVLVVALVASAAAVGITQARGEETAGVAGIFDLISTARAGAEAAQTLRTTTIEIDPASDSAPELVARNAPQPAAATPKPTPVAVDPDATPIPGPATASAVGATEQSRQAPPPPAQPVGGGALAWPVAGGSISQYYHAGHLALDIAAPAGNAVMAAEAGIVTAAGWRNNGGGLVVSIDHGNGMVTVYNHLGQLWVTPGQAVGRGQGIGSVGCTGMCTGPHVHFETIVNGAIVNPLRYL